MNPTAPITLEPVDVDRDADLLHAWVTHPRSVHWMMQELTRAEVAAAYRHTADHPHHHAWLGRVDGEPAFLAETYDPARSEEVGLTDLPDLRPGDLGMHVLVAPPDSPVPGFTRAIFAAVMRHCFADPSVRRVVVEPDVRNSRIHTLNAEAGFVVDRVIEVPGKQAALSFCTREAWEASPLGGLESPSLVPREGDSATGVDHLNPDTLAHAQRHLVTKALSELSHERLLTPVRDSGDWLLTTPDGRTAYRFSARVLELEHWVIDPGSVTRTVDNEPAALDVQEFVVEFAEPLGLPDDLLPVYLEELASTLAAACWKLTHHTLSATDLLEADYQRIEGAMTEGHPAFLANNGRIGFGLDDYAAYAPETGSDVRLLWVAAHRAHTTLSVGAGLSEEGLYAAELDAPVRERFHDRLRADGLDPADYLLVPVHPWQWRNKLAVTFAPDLARRDLVLLGEGPDAMRPQQSIRTFFNASRPERSYVKTALSVQNMGFMRGLSPAYMVPTPAINDWVADLVEGDPELKECGLAVLRERAGVGYTGDAYHAAAERTGQRSAYTKMLAALWRESPTPRVSGDERLATMAALLHRDAAGNAFATALVRASGAEPADWVRAYLRSYLRPIVHCLLAHELAFMPHGENLVLVLRDHVPSRALIKDIGEEVAVMDDQPLPAEVERIRFSVPADVKAGAVHTDVFDGVLRHLAAILDTDGVLGSADFWGLVRECLDEHAADHPELAEQGAAYDLTRAEFQHSCLNRLQLKNTREMVNIADQSESLLYAGVMANPVATRGRPAGSTA